MIQYKTETGVTVARLEELDNTEGWQLKQVLHSWSAGDTITMVVLLYKSLPDTVVMMTPPAKRRPGRPKREAA